MSELRPLDVGCNLRCQYCYQNTQRDAGGRSSDYSLSAMKAALDEIDEPFHLFGGEPLLVPIADLEALWAYGLERFGRNGLQTNGTLISDQHLALFDRYAVEVSISVDGPDALNDARWAGTLEKTRELTAKTIHAIERLCRRGSPPALMLQITRCNGIDARLERLCEWLREVDRLGVRRARVHILEVEDQVVRASYALSAEENLTAFRRIAALEKELDGLRFDVGREQRLALMLQDEDVACVWRACDPYTTEAVNGVGGHGERHNCGLTDKEGIDFQKPDEAGYERYLALYHTPQEYGGCRDCRFFVVCKGQCPGTGIDRDWRNRTEWCAVWKGLFGDQEEALMRGGLTPISRHPRLRVLERAMLDAWSSGSNPTLAHAASLVGIEMQEAP
jgi:uncharacterized protein